MFIFTCKKACQRVLLMWNISFVVLSKVYITLKESIVVFNIFGHLT